MIDITSVTFTGFTVPFFVATSHYTRRPTLNLFRL
jgi:hypothetical protein